jgi:hypothetical protein
MLPKNRKLCAKTISLLAGAVGVAVMIGWIWDFQILKSLSPSWISMKFSTALAFLLSGITLYFIVRAQEGELDTAQVALSISTMMIILLMGILFFSFVFKVHTGAEELFVKDSAAAVKTITPGQPSMLTMVNFMLVAFCGILTMLKPGKPHPTQKIIGVLIAITGGYAVLGYIVDAPLLYYYIEGLNSAMACNTALSFIILGVGFICL